MKIKKKNTYKPPKIITKLKIITSLKSGRGGYNLEDLLAWKAKESG